MVLLLSIIFFCTYTDIKNEENEENEKNEKNEENKKLNSKVLTSKNMPQKNNTYLEKSNEIEGFNIEGFNILGFDFSKDTKTPRNNNLTYSSYYKDQTNPYKQVTNNRKYYKESNMQSNIPIEITNTYYQEKELKIQHEKKVVKPKPNNKRVNFYNYD